MLPPKDSPKTWDVFGDDSRYTGTSSVLSETTHLPEVCGWGIEIAALVSDSEVGLNNKSVKKKIVALRNAQASS